MANSRSALKRVRQNKTRTQRNRVLKNRVKEARKSILTAVEAGDKAAATEAYKVAVPEIDSSVSKGIMHKNKAARSKSRLNARIQAM